MSLDTVCIFFNQCSGSFSMNGTVDLGHMQLTQGTLGNVVSTLQLFTETTPEFL